MRIAIAFDNFGPYHMARLAAAGRFMRVLGVEVAATSTEYAWNASNIPPGVEHARLLDDGSGRSNWSLLLAAYDSRVAPWRPDAIALPGWSSPATLAGAYWASRRGVPIVVMSETNATDFHRHTVTELVKRRIVALFQAGLCGGRLAQAYLAELGLPHDRIFVGYDVVDNNHFDKDSVTTSKIDNTHKAIDPAWRGRCFLASARFIPKKNLPRLVEAFARYRRAAGASAWPLVLLGDGPMRAELEAMRTALELEASLAMPGFVQYGELPLHYGNAGVFVHASTTEQWGLVVNEAMASGLPVLVSERCGCAPDLVENGRNGYTFDPLNVEALAALMLQVSSDTCDRAAMGRASREIIDAWSPDRFGRGLRQAAETALAARPRQSGFMDRGLLWMLSRR
ncbi:glycosyltransferase family 4 protein [Taklimakanibacter deserti]|uniref:glycosyltransferase family 4 protein n=1 Tax=Taklimakanibacter deserti TaxID=2267839 RepID=UPI000E649843